MPGPYFIGYCGEYHRQYPGIVQLAGCSVAGRGGNFLDLSVLCSKASGRHLETSISVSNPQSRHRARLDEESRRFRANICIPPPTSRAFTRIRGRTNAVTPSMARPTRLSMGLPSEREQDILERLQAGEGISESAMLGVLEKCTICKAYFVASLLRIHIRGCNYHNLL